MKDIVGIDEKHGRLRIELRIFFERRELILEEHDPTVRHRSRDGNAELLPRRHRCRHIDTADVCRACAVGRSVHVVRTPRAEVRHLAPLSRTHDARSLRCNQGLMIDLCENRRLDQLRVNDGRNNRHQRLVGIDDRPFRHGVDVPTEAEAAQKRQKLLRKQILCTKIIDVFIRKGKILHELDHMFKPCKDGIAPPVGNRAKEEIEGNAHVAVCLTKVSVGHRHLVEIHHHRQVSLIKLRHSTVPLSGRKKWHNNHSFALYHFLKIHAKIVSHHFSFCFDRKSRSSVVSFANGRSSGRWRMVRSRDCSRRQRAISA